MQMGGEGSQPQRALEVSRQSQVPRREPSGLVQQRCDLPSQNARQIRAECPSARSGWGASVWACGFDPVAIGSTNEPFLPDSHDLSRIHVNEGDKRASEPRGHAVIEMNAERIILKGSPDDLHSGSGWGCKAVAGAGPIGVASSDRLRGAENANNVADFYATHGRIR